MRLKGCNGKEKPAETSSRSLNPTLGISLSVEEQRQRAEKRASLYAEEYPEPPEYVDNPQKRPPPPAVRVVQDAEIQAMLHLFSVRYSGDTRHTTEGVMSDAVALLEADLAEVESDIRALMIRRDVLEGLIRRLRPTEATMPATAVEPLLGEPVARPSQRESSGGTAVEKIRRTLVNGPLKQSEIMTATGLSDATVSTTMTTHTSLFERTQPGKRRSPWRLRTVEVAPIDGSPPSNKPSS